MLDIGYMYLVNVLWEVWYFPLPHIALLLVFTIGIETFALIRRQSEALTWSNTIVLFGSSGYAIYWGFRLNISVFRAGEAVDVDAWYWLFALGILFAAILPLLIVRWVDNSAAKRANSVLSAVRSGVFGLNVFVFLICLAAPLRVNRHLSAIF